MLEVEFEILLMARPPEVHDLLEWSKKKTKTVVEHAKGETTNNNEHSIGIMTPQANQVVGVNRMSYKRALACLVYPNTRIWRTWVWSRRIRRKRWMTRLFTPIVDHINGCLDGWKMKFISLMDLQVLAQSILASIPYFSMQSTFLLGEIYDLIDSLL